MNRAFALSLTRPFSPSAPAKPKNARAGCAALRCVALRLCQFWRLSLSLPLSRWAGCGNRGDPLAGWLVGWLTVPFALAQLPISTAPHQHLPQTGPLPLRVLQTQVQNALIQQRYLLLHFPLPTLSTSWAQPSRSTSIAIVPLSSLDNVAKSISRPSQPSPHLTFLSRSFILPQYTANYSRLRPHNASINLCLLCFSTVSFGLWTCLLIGPTDRLLHPCQRLSPPYERTWSYYGIHAHRW